MARIERTCLAAGRGSARRARCGEFKGQQHGVRWKFQQVDESLCRQGRSADVERPGGVMLYPLAQIGVGVLVSIVVGSRQLVMDVLRHGKRRKGKQ